MTNVPISQPCGRARRNIPGEDHVLIRPLLARWAASAFLPIALSLAIRAGGATFDVDATDDAVDAAPGDGACATVAGTCTLRAAVMETNAVAGPHLVRVPAGTYALTIPGTGGDSQGSLEIGRETTIEGAGADVVIVDAGGADRAFVEQASSGTVVLRGMSLRNGRSQSSYGGLVRSTGIAFLMEDCVLENGLAANGSGGGFGAQADSNIVRRCTFRGNDAVSGGGVFVTSSVLLEDCLFEANTATRGAGAATYTQFGSMTLRGCELRDNVATSGGGGVRNEGSMTIDSCTFTGNRAGTGGAVQHDCSFSSGQTRMTNCTLHGNTASVGGGFAKVNVGTMTVIHGTIASNVATSDHGGFSGDGGVTLRNTIVHGNTAPNRPDCGSAPSALPVSGGYNLIGDAACVLTGSTSTDIRARDPMLSAPADNGGPVRTQALPAASPAVDAIPAASGSPLDARGVARPADGNGDGTLRSDIGAYELEPIAAQGLAVNRSIALLPLPAGAQPAVATAFDAACVQPAWSLCPEEVIDAPLAGLVVSGEAAPAGTNMLRLYEHSDPTTTMTVRRQGVDLVFAP